MHDENVIVNRINAWILYSLQLLCETDNELPFPHYNIHNIVR